MKHWGVGARLLSCASVIALGGAFAGSAQAHSYSSNCTSITHPTTINHDKKCVRVTKTINGNVVNNATVGKSHGNENHYYSNHNDPHHGPGFFVGSGGLLTGQLINNGWILGGEHGTGALTLGKNANVQGGIINNGGIFSHGGSGVSLGYYDRDKYPRVQAVALTGDIVNNGLIYGDDYGVAARYGTMSGTLINGAHGAIIGGDIGVFILDSFTSWSGGIENSGLIFGDEAGIQIGGSEHGGEYGGEYNALNVTSPEGVHFSGGIFNYDGGEIISRSGPSIAIGGASFSGGVYNDGLITQYLGYGDGYHSFGYGGEHGEDSLYRGVGIVFTAPTVEGGLLNDVNGEIYGRKGPAVWITDHTQSFSGGITNHGLISGADDAIRIESALFAGGLTNGASGSIVAYEGDGVFASSAWSGDVQNHGLISGADNGFAYAGSTFDGNFGNAGLIEGGHAGVVMSGTAFDGAFTNTGSIDGGLNGVALSFGHVSGGFTNGGLINGHYGSGVAIDVDTWGAAEARADIHNEAGGVIIGGETGFLLDAGTVYGDFINDGLISGGGTNTGVHIIAGSLFGDIVNNDEISSPYDALVADIDLFDGSFANAGDIAGGDNGAVLIVGQMTGGFSNSGSISGAYGNGVDVTVDNWGAADAPAAIVNAAEGVITGGATGFALNAGTLHGSFTNDGVIEGGTNGVSVVAQTFDAPFANSGDISGGVNGVVLALQNASGGFSNSGSITGEYGNGVDIVVTNWGSADVPANIVNAAGGVIGGGATGFAIDIVTLHGDVTNVGAIDGGNVGLAMTGGTFDGAFANTGNVAGGVTGVSFVLSHVAGGFTNSGSITGGSGDGVSIDVDSWGLADARADIVNEAGGVITGGDTGFLLDAGTVHGDFINDGLISGGGADTGVHIIAGEFFGDIVNNDEITSAYDALVADIETFDGAFANTGTIAGGDNGAVLIVGQMTGGFSNSGGISGALQNGVDITVDAWGSTDVPAAIVNTADGVITGGDVGFALNAGTLHGSVANDGTIAGGTTGASFVAATFDAPFANSGAITGGANGVVMVLGDATGGFNNSGTIAGASANGVDILVTNWGAESARADIVNTADGVISGGATGFAIELVTMRGDVNNDGLIEGGNVGVLMAGETFDGAFTNTGDIDGGTSGVVMNLSSVSGAFTNSGSITGAGGDGVAITVDTWGTLAARADIVNEAGGVIAGGDTGFLLNAGTVHGDFINDGLITGGGANTGVHIIAGEFVGDIVNNDEISSAYDALVADIDTFDGSFANTATIAGGDNGALMILGEMTADFTNSGSIRGAIENGVDISVETWGSSEARVAILNTADGAITGGGTGFALDAGTLHGSFTNDGVIDGGVNGASFTADTFDAAFANSGAITGGDNGVVMVVTDAMGGFSNSGSIGGAEGNGVDIVATNWGTQSARADIVNTASGVIAGGDTGFLLDVGTMHGDFINNGEISGGGLDTGVHIIAGQLNGDIVNNDLISSPHDALVADIDTFNGSFANTATIAGGDNGAVMILGEMTGDFNNSGSISGAIENGVDISVETWGSTEARVDITNAATGVITGGATGFALDAGSLHGAFTNDGTIQGGTTGASFAAETFDAPFANSGDIAGGVNGVVIVVTDAAGGFTNGGSIDGGTGDGVDIVVTSWGTAIADADIVNTADGGITGGITGFAIELVTLHGDVTNDGLVEGDGVAVAMSGGAFDGAFTNTGEIGGGGTGVSLALSSVSGQFTNSGSVDGATDTGVAIEVGAWGSAEARANIVNTASGTISGGQTGFLLDVGTMHGDFINDGAISGGGPSTGVHIIAGTFVGDIVNNDAIDAPSNALDLDIGNLDGAILNTGTITATAPGGIAVALNIGNGATFTNTSGGLIIGDTVFEGEAAYQFVAGDGGLEGNLIGEGGEANDDTIAVTGTHTFVGGTASNFASFTVEDGGTAIMGALLEGDTAGTGYAFSNVDALNVNNGGTLYIDRTTTLVVDNSYTQQAGGSVVFFLGAPGGDGFEDLTGNVEAGDGDYGQILVNGSVTLDGSVVGMLDPAFADANPGLNQVLYEDVITATGGISGDFGTVALIADSSIFELNEVIDGNTVDLTVSRTSLVDLGSLPGIVVNTGGPFDAMVSDRSNGIGSGSCGLAGDGWCFNRFAANDTPGASQVMTDAPSPDPFAWLRTGVRKVGETAVWGRVIKMQGETDGDANSSGSEFDTAGMIGGIDHVFTPILMAGVAAQWTTADIDFKGRADNAEVENFEAGVYASYGDTRLYLNANASVIWHSIEVFRFTPGGNAVGEYDGTTFSAFAEGGKTFETEDGVRIQPFLALSYSHLETDAYSELGTGALLNVGDSEFDSLKSMVGVRVGYPIPLKSGRKLVPEARLAWAHEFMDNQASFLATIQGQQQPPSLVLGEKFSRDTLIAGAGVTIPLSDSSSVFVDYDAGLNADITTHTVSVGVRLTW